MKRFIINTFVIVLLFFINNSGLALADSFDGEWTGQWYSYDEGVGNVNATITQNGSTLSGTLDVTNTDCGDFYDASLSGTAYGDSYAEFNATVYCSLDYTYYSLYFTQGYLDNNQITGSYKITYGDNYIYDTGTFALTRSVNIITASAGTGGSISPSGPRQVAAGTDITFTMTPTSGYEISDVKVNNISVGAVSTYTFNDVGENYTISATFFVPAPVADFSASPTSGKPPLSVVFTNTSTGNITGMTWDFGDSSTSTSENPAHTYSSAGTYTVQLTVSGPGGSDTETKTDYISVRSAFFPFIILLDD
jgi:hypothetical protein